MHLGTNLVCWYTPSDGMCNKPYSAVLGSDDLVDVLEEVIEVAPQWHFLGLALRLKVAELAAISSNNHTDPNKCLKDMLLSWLQQRYDTNRFGQPSWRMLCQAISKPTGGNNPALGRKIAKCHHKPIARSSVS